MILYKEIQGQKSRTDTEERANLGLPHLQIHQLCRHQIYHFWCGQEMLVERHQLWQFLGRLGQWLTNTSWALGANSHAEFTEPGGGAGKTFGGERGRLQPSCLGWHLCFLRDCKISDLALLDFRVCNMNLGVILNDLSIRPIIVCVLHDLFSLLLFIFFLCSLVSVFFIILLGEDFHFWYSLIGIL